MGQTVISSDKVNFSESKNQVSDSEKQAILSRRINELPLKIQGTRLETFINKLYLTLEERGIIFRPKCYLSDDWGCPDGVPVIGIPFYLADPRLSQLEGELTGINAEDDREILMYLYHEAGHAFNYAYKLYLQSEWRSLFGLFSKAYKEDYKPKPFSPSFVRHIPGWYAQKHPDEDFAETFAVWLTNKDWKETYNETPALTKLLYVERIVGEWGKRSPLVTKEILDSPIEELTETLKDWYSTETTSRMRNKLPEIINEDLKILFNYSGGNMLASDFISSNRLRLSQDINYWTGIDRERIESLINELIKRAKLLSLKVDNEKKDETLVNLTIFTNTLVMNYLYTDNFAML